MEKTKFLAVTEADQEAIIAVNIVAREQELFSYETNIENYEAALALPDISPGFRRNLMDLLAGEKREHEKSKVIYTVLLTKIPEAKKAAALNAAKISMQPKP
jgi:hypothetical protein